MIDEKVESNNNWLLTSHGDALKFAAPSPLSLDDCLEK